MTRTQSTTGVAQTTGTSGRQPTETKLADIRPLGVAHVIHLALHTHEKAPPDETGSVRRLGMTYTHIPVDFQNPPGLGLVL